MTIKTVNHQVLIAAILVAAATAQSSTYLGFDRNVYPGDANLPALHQSFSYAGFWLNNPPGESSNTWTGHRAAVQSAGFGFLVLFNGRLYAELESVAQARRLGRSDANKAVTAAKREGFPTATIIFLDQEQGGRMLPEQKAYIYSWVDAVTAAGFRAGIYCSAIPSPDSGHVVTAEDIRKDAGSRQIIYWAINDACPPAPGCAFPQHPPTPDPERDRVRRSLAVCAVSAAQRRRRPLHQLRPRWRLLSAGNNRDAGTVRRSQFRNIARSISRSYKVAPVPESPTFSICQ